MGIADMLIGMGIGLIIGWNVLPQPVWVRDLWKRIAG